MVLHWNIFICFDSYSKACTGGGCSVSEASTALTEESTPEVVPAPKAQSYSSDSFNISWTKPEYPNGKWTLLASS